MKYNNKKYNKNKKIKKFKAQKINLKFKFNN